MKFDKKAQEKLAQDLKAANEAAQKAFTECMAKHGDRGTCNFDSAVLYFPRIQATKVLAVGEQVGVRLFKDFRGRYHVSTPCGGQGFARTAQAEAMYNVLKAAGWETGMYYQMD
jgi:hypothetical protein